jgi:hypothetical protein
MSQEEVEEWGNRSIGLNQVSWNLASSRGLIGKADVQKHRRESKRMDKKMAKKMRWAVWSTSSARADDVGGRVERRWPTSEKVEAKESKAEWTGWSESGQLRGYHWCEVANGQVEDSDDEGPARKKSKKRSGAAGKKAAVPRKRKAATTAVADEPSSQMKTDCALFSAYPSAYTVQNICWLADALVSPDIALLPLVEEWVETYQQTAEDETSETASVHELIQFFIRCCGLNADVEEHETLDVDGIVDAIERIQDESMLVSSVILLDCI